MKKPLLYWITVLVMWSFVFCQDLLAQPDTSLHRNNKTYTHEETIAAYQWLAKKYGKKCVLEEKGKTDSGRELHLFTIRSKAKDPFRLLINNAIHPGEPDGVNASIKLAWDILEGSVKIHDDLEISIIPAYNIGGMLNRNCCSRANQDGPEEYGFRGNARNLDLNRDFIKMDSRNAKSFIKIFRSLDPDILVDTHVSNGADYPYTMTLLPTQPDKLGGRTGAYLRNTLTPFLFELMKKEGEEMCPYVYTKKETPEDGIEAFVDSPRFATGYAALFQTIGLTTETHMLKSFEKRVDATYLFIVQLIKAIERDGNKIKEVRQKDREDWKKGKEKHSFNFTVDTTRSESLLFKGYTATYPVSDISGKPRLKYDRGQPWEKEIRFYSYCQPQKTIELPSYYIVPPSWEEAIDRLKVNDVKYTKLKTDSILEVEVYTITDYQTVKGPYEGHYLHSKIQTEKSVRKIKLLKGSLIIPVAQEAGRYVVETLEPESEDSFLAWNYFDGILQQKEWFSSYVFEDRAAELLVQDPELKKKLEDKKAADPEFAGNAFAQLYFIYRNSPNFESTFMVYPVYRLK